MKLIITILISLLGFWLPLAHAEISDEQALAWLQKETPKIHREIAPLQKEDPQDYRNALDEAKEAVSEHQKLIAADDKEAAAAYVKMYEIDFAAISIADEIVLSSDEKQKESLTAKLKELISMSFEHWAVVEKARVRRLEVELQRLKSELATALGNKQQVVEKDAMTLLAECRDYQAKKKASAK